MEGTFNSAKQAYQYNFVQFSLTGEEKYRKAYTAAQDSIQKILAEMKTPEQPEQRNYHEMHDVAKSRLGRLQVHSTPPMPNLTWQYIATGVLVAIVAGLTML
jgi:hypothetical protein